MSDADHGQVNTAAAEIYESFFLPALFSQWPARLLNAVGVERGDRVLDVGTGTGVAARAAAERVGPSGDVQAIDPNAGMLAVARRSPLAIGWVSGGAEALPFDPGRFDRVISQFALMFFADRAASIAEMARVLRPGGTVAIAVWASLEMTPGYAAMVDLLDRLFGRAAAGALSAPYSMGDADALAELVGRSFKNVRVDLHPGEARFDSIDDWVYTDIRGWTLADAITDEEFEQLRAEAAIELARFTDAAGHVSFAAPALIATGIR
ncbi:MAG: methyltransferase domain-containing protein [Chloroflexi bacterium]|nr:methyltransferase domain-containing protein [Chloroflexota bacterium]